MREITGLMLGLIWIAGFVIAKGFWSTLFCIIPFWAFYLVIEFTLISTGLLS